MRQVYQLWCKGGVSSHHPDIIEKDAHGLIKHLSQTNSLRHELSLLSGYESVYKKEPEFTNFTENFRGTLDYIWFSPESLNILAVSKVDDEGQLTDEGALPSSTRPSDHISLVTTVLYCDPAHEKSRMIRQGQIERLQGHHKQGRALAAGLR